MGICADLKDGNIYRQKLIIHFIQISFLKNERQYYSHILLINISYPTKMWIKFALKKCKYGIEYNTFLVLWW